MAVEAEVPYVRQTAPNCLHRGTLLTRECIVLCVGDRNHILFLPTSFTVSQKEPVTTTSIHITLVNEASIYLVRFIDVADD